MKSKKNCRSKVAFGITSVCENGSHIFMSDIDSDVSIKEARIVYSKIIEEYGLSRIYLLKSSCGYNAFSLDKLPLKLVHEINSSNSLIDAVYNDLQFTRRGFYTLRIGMDKKVIDFVNSKNCIFVRSNAHRIFFNNIFSLDIRHLPFIYDDCERFRVIRFLNGKHGVDVVG